MPKTPYPEHWFFNVKKIYVMETVDYYSRTGCTTIIVHYKQWWKLRRKLKFPRNTKSSNTQGEARSPEADAVLTRLKEGMSRSIKKGSIASKSWRKAISAACTPFQDLPIGNIHPVSIQNRLSGRTAPQPQTMVLEEKKEPTDGTAPSVSMIFITVQR